MIEDQVLKPDGPLLANVALGLYEEDPRDAVATLDAIRPPATAAEALLDLVDRVPDAPADVRDDLLTRALARAREVDEPARRVALTARVADRRFEAGEPEKARPLLDEARAGFKEPGSGRRRSTSASTWPTRSRGSTCRRPWPCWRGDEEIEATISRADRPAGPRANDPAGAERIFARLTQRPARLDVLADLCAGMAEQRSAEGDRPGHAAGAPGVAALTVAAAARSKASADPAGARKLLAEAYRPARAADGEDGRARGVDGAAAAAGRPGRPGSVVGVPLAGDRGAAAARRGRGPRVGDARDPAALPGPRPARGAGRPLRPRGGRDDLRPGRRERPGPDRRPLRPQRTRPARSCRPPRPSIRARPWPCSTPCPKTPSRSRAPAGGPPAFAPRTKEKARLAVARALALPPAARRREALSGPRPVRPLARRARRLIPSSRIAIEETAMRIGPRRIPRAAALFLALVLLVMAVTGWRRSRRRGFRPAPRFEGATIPDPPRQGQPWTPPETSLPRFLVRASATLFEQGLADPRGGDYRAIEIGVGSVWSNVGGDPRDARLGPARDAGRKDPVRGHLERAGLPDRLRRRAGRPGGRREGPRRRGPRPAEGRARAAGLGAAGAFGGFGTNHEAFPVSLTGLHPIKVGLLLRIGRADLAETVWAAATGRPREEAGKAKAGST